MHPWVIKNQVLGATFCCQNALVVIRHRKPYICCEPSFGNYFTCLHKYFIKNLLLCVLTLLLSGNTELYFENCSWFNRNCPWFIPNPHEPGAILKCKLQLLLVSLFYKHWSTKTDDTRYRLEGFQDCYNTFFFCAHKIQLPRQNKLQRRS